jgi:nitrite reductase/ring-hydroxylating ferredoxin subunit
MSLLRRPSELPLWRDEITIDAADERYVTRRQLTKFLVLTSFGMFVGQLWILARSLFARTAPPPLPRAVAHAGDLAVGGARVFHFPSAADPCLLVRTDDESYVAYSQKCTHLSCAVYFDPGKRRIECPCHEGAFSAADGRVLQGPPPRPLPRIRLERRGDEIVATAVEAGGPVDDARADGPSRPRARA